ncbi:FHA domain-containing protein PS1-like isoform X2 [Mangifera indica]|uniref:FHA domain-containing protein PS1-like isoform X2 n=1 Tax=Mangifera indica TaxID=29780 RepID=UPI001CF98A9D|nr:FHA domain-containing protein PS1-like isoform X2 [Mangifera indica]
MAENKTEERKIPVFTVIKNGAILKNIFLIDKPPPPSPSIMAVQNEDKDDDEEKEEILMVGRHPDCHIMLTHPSISRFHLQIHAKPYSRNLSVIDLSSVHGTRVSERKIEPCVPVELNEGDTLKIGGSTRVYRLHWIPLSQAYDMDYSFVSELDVPVAEEQEEESQVEPHQGLDSLSIEEFEQVEEKKPFVVEEKGGMCQDEISILVHDKPSQSLDWILEGIASLFCDERSELILETEIPFSETLPIDMACPVGGNMSVPEEQHFDKHDQIQCHDSMTEFIPATENSESSKRSEKKSKVLVNFVASPLNAKQQKLPDKTEHQSPLQEEIEKRNNLEDWSGKESANSSLVLGGVVSEINTEQIHKENELPLSLVMQPSEAEMIKKSSMDKNINMLLAEGQQFDENDQIPCRGSMTEFIPATENSESSKRSEKKCKVLVNFVASSLDAKQQKLPDETENQSPLQEEIEVRNNLEDWSGKQSAKSSLVLGGIVSEINTEQIHKENEPLVSLVMQPSEAEMLEKSLMEKNMNMFLALNSGCFNGEGFPEAQVFEAGNRSQREGLEQKEISHFCSSVLEESVNSSLPIGEVLNEVVDSKNSRTPQSVFYPEGVEDQENPEVSPLRSDRKPSSHSIWSRRGKPASALQIQTSRSRGKTTRSHNKAVVGLQMQEDMENKSISKILFTGFGEKEEEFFSPNKENFSPDTLLIKSLKRKGKLEEIKPSRSCRKSSSKVTISPNIQLEEDLISSDKENQTPKVLQEWKLAGYASRNHVKLEQERVTSKKRAERVPFQSLAANSSGMRRSEHSLPNGTTSCNSVNLSQTMKITHSSSIAERRRSWVMVVDASTLLDKQSRKSLQLLQGLKGTQLIIPRMVIRELGCLKSRGSLFRRTTEVSSVLEWIEECLVKTKWWIHVQNSMEEERPLAPTPPASPKSLFSEGSCGSFPSGTKSWGVFSAATGFTEIVSPTAEDHVLDCALLFRKKKMDGQLVLLSNDVTLKIKAMAEGLNCETAQEFRESLVNPFSDRFLWADSSPRGLTWSVLDDIVLRERYNCGPLKKTSKGGDGAKGLKLILLHNSHYSQMHSVR